MSPETVIIAAAVVCTGLVLVLVKLTRHFAAPQPIPVAAEWIDELSIDAASLQRLLDEGRFTPKLVTTLRIQRYQLLHEHLRHLEDDFKLVCMALKVIVVESKQDRPDLAWALVRNQITFTFGLMMVRFQLVRHRYGF